MTGVPITRLSEALASFCTIVKATYTDNLNTSCIEVTLMKTTSDNITNMNNVEESK